MELKHKMKERFPGWEVAFNRTLWNWNKRGIVVDFLQLFPFNRTLWNWNVGRLGLADAHAYLLIEPYGIETPLWCGRHLRRHRLLIEPYGIETQRTHLRPMAWTLLIEPYGIETTARSAGLAKWYRLLIEPYGIETLHPQYQQLHQQHF